MPTPQTIDLFKEYFIVGIGVGAGAIISGFAILVVAMFILVIISALFE